MQRSLFTLAALAAALLAAAPAASYTLRTNASGQPVVWNAREIAVQLDATAIPEVKGVAAAVQAAFDGWWAGGIPIEVKVSEVGGRLAVARDGVNAITWEPTNWKYGPEVVAMTVSYYLDGAGAITEADIVVNARDLKWTTKPNGKDSRFDVQDVFSHEAGHFFGLGHSPDVAHAAMYPWTPPGEVTKRTLSEDDLAAATAIAAEMEKRLQTIGYDLPPPEEGDPADRLRGCAVGPQGARGAGLGLLVPVGLALLLLRRRSRVLPRRSRDLPCGSRGLPCLLAAAALLSIPASARASVLRPLPLSELAARAEVIVEGRVVAQRSFWEDRLIHTEHRILVTRCHRGGTPGAVLLRTPGGKVGDLVAVVDGSPVLRLGDPVFVFARRQGASVVPVGLALGLFQVKGLDAVRSGAGIRLPNGARLAEERVPISRLREVVRKWSGAAQVGRSGVAAATNSTPTRPLRPRGASGQPIEERETR